MKLASLKGGGRDGTLVVVDSALETAVAVPGVAATLQAALDDWASIRPALQEVARLLSHDQAEGAFPFAPEACAAPLPRAYHWADGSAYVTHVELVRRARGAELPASFWEDPLMYMGASDAFIGPCDDVPVEDEAWGIDFESEVAVITDDVPAGTPASLAGRHVALVTIVNDVSLRGLIPGELAKQFGFYQSKPWTAFAPVAVTPDELGAAWDGARVHLPLISSLNGRRIGAPDAGHDMTFSFPELIAHAARTRHLMAGTVIGSGTIANEGSPSGSSCLAEVRSLETIRDGEPSTPFMRFGDRIRIEMFDADGETIFGAIDQRIARHVPPAE